MAGNVGILSTSVCLKVACLAIGNVCSFHSLILLIKQSQVNKIQFGPCIHPIVPTLKALIMDKCCKLVTTYMGICVIVI